ncbi:DUF2333 family protein [Desulfobacter latus]|uniref:DUF2333 family protein n=1 Tax=Desulfobacter latus TaxID=2292 RepID=A0A850SRW0_9BACT|nr:DUF2333 family protein [Desulfobacter latus]NWH04164.1 DUF2333 family protein [Desulfobacter latus]
MEEAKNAANGGDAVKKKSFLKKIFISKWVIIIVLILGVFGYATWWGISSWKDFTAKRGGQTHETQITRKTNASHDIHSTATDTMHETLSTHQPAAQKHNSHAPSQHADEFPKHTLPHTAFNESADENKAAGHESATPTAEHGTMHAAPVRTGPRGVAFVEACIKPLDHELNHRFWGWRPNDIIRFTDNINNLQLGVLEVTRRTAVALAENLSRTGRADAYVPGLEYAMNSFMIKPSEYMFPSAESKYQEGLDEWRNYQKMLERGDARFYRRLDNLVPLLKAYESILGSCDENLVKELGHISSFDADDVFYYTKGVATAMSTILEAVAIDFDDTIGSVQGMDLIHHTIEALHHATHMDPWIVLEGSPDGILANHRANIAASISHARFYLDVLSRSLTGNL